MEGSTEQRSELPNRTASVEGRPKTNNTHVMDQGDVRGPEDRDSAETMLVSVTVVGDIQGGEHFYLAAEQGYYLGVYPNAYICDTLDCNACNTPFPGGPQHLNPNSHLVCTMRKKLTKEESAKYGDSEGAYYTALVKWACLCIRNQDGWDSLDTELFVSFDVVEWVNKQKDEAEAAASFYELKFLQGERIRLRVNEVNDPRVGWSNDHRVEGMVRGSVIGSKLLPENIKSLYAIRSVPLFASDPENT